PDYSLNLLRAEFEAGAVNKLDNFSHFFHFALAAGDRGRSPLRKAAEGHFRISEVVRAAKSKNITHTALQRAALHAILNLEQVAKPEYIRVLGFRREKSWLIAALQQKSTLPVITNLKSAKIHPTNEIKATELYWLALKPQNIPERKELATPMVII
ncbi:MAG: nucleotidyltransferase family protein, partial [Clostridiales bacterium]|nr:nucleotidyltransferase family protein [Clostridiales bacterium]